MRFGRSPRARRTGRALGMTAASAVMWWTAVHATSPAVRGWEPSRGPPRRVGRLAVRALGSGDPVVLLLHGMVAAGNTFGAGFDPLAQHAAVVVPDLLGFGDSTNTPVTLGAEGHLDALDEVLHELGLEGRPLLIAGHSMGAVVGLRFAVRHIGEVRGVVTFGAPLWDGPGEAARQVAAMGLFEALLAGEGPRARAVCAWMCRHRRLASWLVAAARPDLPVAVARSGVKHSWQSYTGAYRAFLRGEGWQPALDTLLTAGVPVLLTAGARDPVPGPEWPRILLRRWPAADVAVHPDADHGLPLSHARWCRHRIEALLASTGRSNAVTADGRSYPHRSARR